MERDKSTPTSRPSRSLLRADRVPDHVPRNAAQRKNEEHEDDDDATISLRSPPSSYLETRAQSYEGSRTLVHRRVVSVHVCLPFYEDTKRSAGSMQIYAGRSLRVSRERAGRDGDNPHRILGYRIHECPPLLVHGKSCTRALKVELDIYICARILLKFKSEEKYRPVVFLFVYIHTLDGDFIRI